MTYKDPARQKEYYRMYALAHRDKRRQIHHRSEWKSNGLEVSRCEQVYDSATKCDICGTRFGDRSQKNLDHDHRTKAIRGVLCANCNLAIGLLNDDPALIAKSIEYLGGS